MSGSTKDTGGVDPADRLKMREGVLIGLRKHSPAAHLRAFEHTSDVELPSALLAASVILQYAAEFDNEVVRRAGMLLEAHKIGTAPDDLPLWVYRAVNDRLRATNSTLASSDEPSAETYITTMVDMIGRPQVRANLLVFLRSNSEDLLHAVFTQWWYRYPIVAVCAASIILEHSDEFGVQLMADAISLLAQLGQSTDPGAPLVATTALIEATELAANLPDDDEVVIAVFGFLMPGFPGRSDPMMN